MVYGNVTELDWLTHHPRQVRRFTGQWVAILDEEIVAHGRSVAAVMQAARRRIPSDRLPLVTKIPRRNETNYIL